MAADQKMASCFIKRKEQIKSWKDSMTNLEPVLRKREESRVKFQDGCVFLAACSSGDVGEVKKLLESQTWTDINTTNADGLTALHQACIDDNFEMVQFLVENGADVNAYDNEGWTPLHATASCGFTEIARYLIKHEADVATVNNDGDLPMDIADNAKMENLLQEEIDKQGINAETSKHAEKQCMLADVNRWLRDRAVKEIQHPKTGATSLHVAASKGYIEVLNLLLKAGVNVNAEDYDGWTPLHAAAHWGQEEACKILVENMCDMMHRNKAGQTAFDLAEKDLLKFLQDLKVKQTSIKNKQEKNSDIILSSTHTGISRDTTRSTSENIAKPPSDEPHSNILIRTSDRQRDEETETQRKVRAKHARKTRRSTQGVLEEDLEKAEELLHQGDKVNVDIVLRSSKSPAEKPSILKVTSSSSASDKTGRIATSTSSVAVSVSTNDKSVSSGYRSKDLEDKSFIDVGTIRSSFRRSRESRDTSSSTDITSTYIPRSQRIISAETKVKSSPSEVAVLRPSSSQDLEGTSEEAQIANVLDKKDERKETSAIRARRQRRERRSTGILMDGEEGAPSNNRKAEEEENADQDNNDSTDHTLMADNSSTSASSTHYKQKYEEEKSENKRLRKELDETVLKLVEAKAEIDKLMRQTSSFKTYDRDKRTTEKKLLELEEECKKMETLKSDNQKLKDENGALIRVISKLSKQ